MKGLVYNKVYKYRVTVKCEGPLHIGSAVGSAEEVLIHPVTGDYFVQASSIAGVFRSYYKGESELSDMLFGNSNSDSNNSQSRARFTDGIFNDEEKVRLELRPHVKIERSTGSVASSNDSGEKFNMEYIGAGAEFTFSIYLYDDGRTKKLKEALEEIIYALDSGELQFGAKKSSGCGFVSIVNIDYKEFNLKNEEDFKDWIDEESIPDEKYEKGYQNKISANINSSKAYSIKIYGETEGTIQIKGIAVNEFGKNAPGSESIINSNNDYFIPGSSLRGSVRSRMEIIAEYLNKNTVIIDSFGYGNNGEDTGKTGNLIFRDTIIDNNGKEKLPISRRIRVDKFTGGVFHGGLFSERNVAGKLELNMRILNRNNPDSTLGLLIFAIRDLAIGSMNFGSGFSIGKGFINVSKIEIIRYSDNKKVQINLEDEITIDGTKEIINNAFYALKQAEA